MRITEIKTTPLLVPNATPVYWAQGVGRHACVILVEVHTDEGIQGYGESLATPTAEGVGAYLRLAAEGCIGRSPFDIAVLMSEAYHTLFQANGACSAPRFAGQVLAGLEMALWDVVGKAANRPVHELLGGAVRDRIQYFGFAQGESAAEVTQEAQRLVESGFEVIYVKVGRGDALDLDTLSAVRSVIGPDRRLRVDPNEHWTPAQLARMLPKLTALGVEMVEQPTHAESVSALAQARAHSGISLSADQSVFTHFDAFDVCRERAADLIVIGLHETGGLLRFKKVADVAEAAGINVCIHGLHETGITTCASAQVAATVFNLDDANQIMNQFLAWDLVESPDLLPKAGKLTIPKAPGLGFELNWDAVENAKRCFLQSATR